MIDKDKYSEEALLEIMYLAMEECKSMKDKANIAKDILAFRSKDRVDQEDMETALRLGKLWARDYAD